MKHRQVDVELPADITIEVNAKALQEILLALTGPPHLIREIMATTTICKELNMYNPFLQLVEDNNKWVLAIEAEAKNKSKDERE